MDLDLQPTWKVQLFLTPFLLTVDLLLCGISLVLGVLGMFVQHPAQFSQGIFVLRRGAADFL